MQIDEGCVCVVTKHLGSDMVGILGVFTEYATTDAFVQEYDERYGDTFDLRLNVMAADRGRFYVDDEEFPWTP